MGRPRPTPPIASRNASTKPPAAAAGITRKLSRKPSRSGSADANRKLDTDAKVLGAISKVEHGSQPDVPALFGPALFYVSSHAVVGRFACLTVVPILVIFSVTPPPEWRCYTLRTHRQSAMMRTNGRSQAIFGGLLWGDRPLRYIFVDEAGTSARERISVVVGIIANADEHVMSAEALALEVLRGVPVKFRDGFKFS